MNLAVELFRSVPRYVAARAVGNRMPGALAGPVAPLRLVQREDPRLPGAGWGLVRPLLSGICGSDLATISGRTSLYFSPLVSWPFVPGHEVVGALAHDIEDLPAGTRVVLDPVLSCVARGVPACGPCAEGNTSRCEQITVGHLSPGLQTGYCADTGGGWGRMLAAHRSQLHPVPDDMPDRRALLVEPLACAGHAVRRAGVAPEDHVLIVGAGTVGVLTVLALRALTQAGPVTVVAKHPAQRDLATALGATDVIEPDQAVAKLRRASRALRLHPDRGEDYLLGGVDIAFDCVGGSRSLDQALRTTRAGGRVVLAGLPPPSVDLAPVWYRELELVGAYASNGSGTPAGGSDFATALQLASDPLLDTLLGATYPLAGWREAIDHAYAAGRLGTFKVAFEPQRE
jgi:threonine dehydrogenase-like Zn-dependent dehydrogenase